jgi:threonine dehydrogenase-like Zn-dependent dehydrogenase
VPKIKTLVLRNKKVWIEEKPDPTPKNELVVVKVESTTICGSDKPHFLSDTPLSDEPGHEGAGIVVATDGSSLLKEGDRVILNPLSGCGVCSLCRSGNYIYCPDKPPYHTHFAQYVLAQDFVCSILPEDISYDLGSLACCALGPAFSSLKRLDVKGFDTVLITGVGPVGMGAVTIAKFLGAKVIALESIPFRKEMARSLGADVVLDPMDPDIRERIKDAKGDSPLLKAVEASGSPVAERLCIDMVDPCGSVAFIGENFNEISIGPSDDFIRKGLTLIGSWHLNTSDREEMYSILRRSPVVKNIITDIYGFSNAQAAFDKFMSGDTGKVILKPWE